MKILVVDDEYLIRDVIKEYCFKEKYDVIEASNGEDAISKCDDSFDLIIMDIMMPELDGFSAVREIKKQYNIPVIMLSARGEEYDKLLGFDLGIDDYVTKPFSPKEVMARVKAVLKRQNPVGDEYIYQTLVVNFTAHTIKIDGKEVDVTPKEYELLLYFIENRNSA